MKKTLKSIFTIFSTCFLLFLCPLIVNGASATTSFNSNSSVYIGNNIDVTLSINTDAPIVAIQGVLNYDKSKLELVSQTSLAPFEVVVNGTKVGGMDMTGNISITGSKKIIKLTFKAKELGSTKISFSGSKQVGVNSATVSTTGCSKTINIVNPPSNNNNLSNLSVSNGSINFNKNTTSYNVSVDSNITSIIVNATAEDSGAKISGTGNKSLSYGNNEIKVTVTAANGDKKTYTINVTRKDNRSSNNNLKSLKINDGTLSPNFSKDTTNYKLNVPYSVTDLDVKATSEDSNAKVSISGNNNLISEETKDVKITVTAENGSKKVYTISVTRGKDPNKVLSDNNYLTHLKPNIGILSPKFDKEKVNYEIWLPYEIDKINFDYDVEDTKYAVVNFEGEDVLQPGITNIYKISVTAENNDTRVYTIQVNRAKNPESTSSNTYLKEIILKNGKLNESFNKEKHTYSYTKNADFEIEAIPEDENSAVKIYEEDNTIYIIVINNGEYGVYRLDNTNNYSIILIILFSIIGVILGFFTHYIINRKK